jgi:phosphohistidine swiveling domain-containing protein
MTLIWEAPGPGRWQWQGSHVPGVPTPLYTELHVRIVTQSIAAMFERYGVPLRTFEERVVNGRLYAALQPLVGKPGASPPPKPALWLATRIHPVFRARTKAAARALGDKIWRARTEEWRSTLRPRVRAANLALQAEDLGPLDDTGLRDHLDRAYANAEAGYLLHFDLHGDDMGPLGLYLSACHKWGIEPGEAIAALTGHSPSTRAPLDDLAAIATALGGAEPTTLDEVRAHSTEAAAALDRYLEEYGWRLVTGYDIDAKTVGELPESLLANIKAAAKERVELVDGTAVGEALRARVPAADRPVFDEALGEARVALDLRDDNGPMTAEWPIGLLRRAILEIGRRLAAAGALTDREHAVELDLPELRAALEGRSPDAAAIAERARRRAELAAAEAPMYLGEAAPQPDLSVFPAPLARVTEMAVTATSLLERSDELHAVPAGGGALVGLGVGLEPCTGTARVASSPDVALARLEPGDVLVVPFTTPAYNAVLALAGAVVTAEGGALSHAAVLARELGIAGVIGAKGAMTDIPDGATVEVDPRTGRVRVLTTTA